MKTLLVAALLFSTSAFALETKKATHLDFEDELIQGSTHNSELLLLMTNGEQSHSRLVQLRQDFKAEMRATAHTIRH